MNKHVAVNQAHWNAVVPAHARAASYDVEGFRAGKCTLRPIEIEEVGEVSGRSLLHLQCHFGLEAPLAPNSKSEAGKRLPRLVSHWPWRTSRSFIARVSGLVS